MSSVKALQQYLETLQRCGIKEIFRNQTNKAELLLGLEQKYSGCTLCKLCEGRIKLVYGSGDPNAKAMIIGEGPGEQENIQGKPFVGKAGELLDRMLIAINLKREDVYIANIVKCRPPGNRNPETDERLACLPYLMEQISIIQPRVLLMMGLVAAQTLLTTNQTMSVLHETTHEFQGIPAFVTYHPAALLRNENLKLPAWKDLLRFQAFYESL
ncbi:MAG TPA: uracil-DNA glycosylase [Candidatus Cloacimonadota bacterium]|nr:uracil-DNA glycosylase [Candidatus Cloacimonadota bacterium]